MVYCSFTGARGRREGHADSFRSLAQSARPSILLRGSGSPGVAYGRIAEN